MKSPKGINETDQTPLLEITSMAYGGKGVARLAGKVYFVPDTIEGDIVRVKITEDKDRYCNAEVTEIVTPSPLRSKPKCKFIETCGGCQWMGISYEQQLAWKKQFIQSSLKRIGKIPDDLDIVVQPSPQIYQYRNRVLLRVHISNESTIKCGYFSRGSRNLVAIDRCDIACEGANLFIDAFLKLNLSGIRNIKVRLEIQELPHGSGKVAVTVHPADGDRDATRELVKRVRGITNTGWVGLSSELQNIAEVEFDTQNDRTYLTIPGQFQQVNVSHNHNLRNFILQQVNERQPRRIFDVFCGSGNLSIGLSDGQRYIEGIEANKIAIDCAQKNVGLNKLKNTKYIAGDAVKYIWQSANRNETFDLVILDPPRQGFHEGMAPLKKMAPEHIIYVSCDPTTLARDIGSLCRDDSYSIVSITGFDFFPNTYHVETVVVLART